VSGSLAGLGAVSTAPVVGAGADVLPGVDSGDRGDDHDHETDDAQEELGRDAEHEEREAREEADAGDRRPPPMNPTGTGAAERVDQLGVFLSECSFHLLEKPLLLV
jgi:hypothetical protein